MMTFNFGEWVVRVAVNGVKAGAFTREWAALQLANYFVRGKLTEADIASFDEAMDNIDAEQQAEQAEAPVDDAEQEEKA